MITLFGKTNCRYTTEVVGILDEYRLSYVKKNIANVEVLSELLDLGGKRQVPYLIDNGLHLYESDAIIAYLRETYGEGKEHPVKMNIHIAEEGTCASL